MSAISPTNATARPAQMHSREHFPRQCLGVQLQSVIKQSRVLMVGAGGIGCELLKNLVLTGFGEIHVVDLDTIDLSNLNRQFLFRQEHIKRSKATVAKESASPFNPNVKIEAHHANIKEPQFHVEWYKSFKLVFNALDNLEARRHVNKMCLAADVPLIESGTTGFNGQVQVIKKGLTECYDCNPKVTPKTFPVCTIRSTPSQPIHCIVWAKSYLFAEIFGTSEDDSPELDNQETSDNAKEMEELRKERFALARIRESMGSEDFPRKVFEKVFTDDIQRLRSMEDMWKFKRMPDVLEFEKLSGDASSLEAAIADKDQTIWSAAENFAVFIGSLRRLSGRLEETRAKADTGNATPVLSFDKDDKDTLDFVASAANLRSIAFDIEPKSEFDIKQMAGNIIPAIATTNAMAAGICVLQAFKVLRGQFNQAKTVFLTRTIDALLASERVAPPKPDCPVCGVCQSHIEVDVERATLQDLVEGLLRAELAYGEEFSVRVGDNLIFDPDLDDNLSKKLSEFDLKGGSSFTVIDESSEDPRVDVVLWIKESRDIAADQKPILLMEKFEIAKKPAVAETATDGGHVNGHADSNGALKRKRPDMDGDVDAHIAKKRGKASEGQSGPIVLDDDEDNDGPSGPIELD